MRGISRGVAAVAACLSTAVLAGPYIAGGATVSKRDYADIDDSTGWRALAGYRFETMPLFLEATYMDTGDADIDPLPGALTGVQLTYEGLQFGIGYGAVLSPLGSMLWLKGGYYTGDAIGKVPRGSIPQDLSLSGEIKQSTSGATLGFGGVWKVTPWVGLRADFETLFGAKDFALDEDLQIYSLGLVFEFPAAKAAPGATLNRATPAVQAAAPEAAPPVAAPAAPASEPVPQAPPSVPAAGQPAPAALAADAAPDTADPGPAEPVSPAPAIAPALASGAHRMRLLAAMPFRDSPKRETAAKATLPIGTVLVLRNRVTTADGDWWFVQTDTDIGWIPVAP